MNALSFLARFPLLGFFLIRSIGVLSTMSFVRIGGILLIGCFGLVTLSDGILYYDRWTEPQYAKAHGYFSSSNADDTFSVNWENRYKRTFNAVAAYCEDRHTGQVTTAVAITDPSIPASLYAWDDRHDWQWNMQFPRSSQYKTVTYRLNRPGDGNFKCVPYESVDALNAEIKDLLSYDVLTKDAQGQLFRPSYRKW